MFLGYQCGTSVLPWLYGFRYDDGYSNVIHDGDDDCSNAIT